MKKRETPIAIGQAVTHHIYGDGRVVRLDGLFAEVCFNKRLSSILRTNSERADRDNVLTVGICAL